MYSKIRICIFGLLISIACLSNAHAAVININTFATGDTTDPGALATVATLTITQNGNDVEFRLDNFANAAVGNTATNANIDWLGLNYTGANPLSSGSFGNFSGFGISSSDFAIGSFNPCCGSDTLNLKLDFPAGNPNNRFKDGDSVTWTIFNTSVSDFLVPISILQDGSGTAYDALTMVHLQGIDVGNVTGGSAKYAGITVVPVPAAVFLFGSGLLGLWPLVKRRSKATTA